MSTADDPFRELPELPLETFEAVGTLERSDRGPFVTLRPHAPPPPKAPPVPATAVSKSSYSIRRYYTQAIYPRLICYDPGVLVESMATRVDPTPVRQGPAGNRCHRVGGRGAFLQAFTGEEPQPWDALVLRQVRPLARGGQGDRVVPRGRPQPMGVRHRGDAGSGSGLVWRMAGHASVSIPLGHYERPPAVQG